MNGCRGRVFALKKRRENKASCSFNADFLLLNNVPTKRTHDCIYKFHLTGRLYHELKRGEVARPTKPRIYTAEEDIAPQGYTLHPCIIVNTCGIDVISCSHKSIFKVIPDRIYIMTCSKACSVYPLLLFQCARFREPSFASKNNHKQLPIRPTNSGDPASPFRVDIQRTLRTEGGNRNIGT